MPQPRTDLSAFATALAERLPDTWTSEYHRHAAHEDQFPTIERLWDSGHVDYIVSQYVLGHDAVLHGPGNEQLYVTDRPLYPHQFLVAPLEPKGFKPHHFRYVDSRTASPSPTILSAPPPQSRAACCPASTRPWTRSTTTPASSPSRRTVLPHRRSPRPSH
ncbi:hypothetical protein GCM10018777_12240 [Streptomyces albogriseolus]|uniref:hypothetical protein n=1 Tax=Streptomyces albogriseolus TaxID=1887 RepID=UPI0016770875|nr:hypothetical protein [Streptomyces viridodiastaticus]MCX4570551.1 hypothetical protein [Streptomyces viridodiastaticus]GHG02821.1 hypothetical protein GCM10018777_12240 [Streptomyces viridodiastaticus]